MTPEYLKGLVASYKNKGMLVDSGPMILYLVGSYNISLLATFKRTLKYSVADYNGITWLMRQFSPRVFTTPNILTEASNLSEKISQAYMQHFAQTIQTYRECHRDSAMVANTPPFKRLGLSDSATIVLSEEDLLVVTDDFPLASTLQSLDRAVLNFNHLRTFDWTFS